MSKERLKQEGTEGVKSERIKGRKTVRGKCWFRRYKKQLGMGFTALSVLIALTGSIQYYSQAKYAGSVVYDRLPSTVLFSVVKLYAFSPTVSTGAATPLCYEIAKWLSPLCTGYWLFRLLEAVLRHRMELLARTFGRNQQILVFGFNRESAVFLSNLEVENRGKGLTRRKERLAVLIPDQILEQERKLSLERERVLVRPPVKREELGEDQPGIKGWLKNFDEAVLFEEDAVGNFAILKSALDWAEGRELPGTGQGKRRWAVRCENRILWKVMEEYYDRFPGKKPFELRLFGMAQMAAEELFAREPLYENCLERARQWMKGQEFPEGSGASLRARAVLEEVPNPHLLIAGFGRLGQAVFEEALLTGNLSCCSKVEGYERLRITIIDRDGEKCREIVESRYPRIEQICQVEYISAAMESVQVERRLRRLPRVTYGAVCFSNQTTALEATEKLRRYFSSVPTGAGGLRDFPARLPIAVRVQSGGAALNFLIQQEEKREASRCVIAAFGSGKKILNRSAVLGSRLEEEAKDFHLGYCRIQQIMEAGQGNKEGELFDREALWNGLNFEQRESNRAQAKSRPYMKELLKLLPPLPPPRQTFRHAGNTDLFLKEIEEGETLDLLAAQEHVRWCNFHYARGYVGRCESRRDKGKIRRIEVGDEVYCGKVHNCLIDSWQEMKEDAEARDTIVYDVCAVYGYASEEAGRRAEVC